MRVVVVGANGMLGSAITEEFHTRGHEVIKASRAGSVKVDIRSGDSIAHMYDEVGRFDALAVATGVSPMGHLTALTAEDFRSGLESKLLGQVQLVLQGLPHINDGGSFTLVSGATSREPIRNGSVLSTVNGAVDAFVASARLDLPRGIRINSVNATVFAEAMADYEEDFPGWAPVPTKTVAEAFVRSALGVETAKTLLVG